MNELQAIPTRIQVSSFHMNSMLMSWIQVLLGCDVVKLPNYDGSFKVLMGYNKTPTILLNGKEEVVSIDIRVNLEVDQTWPNLTAECSTKIGEYLELSVSHMKEVDVV